MAHFRVLVIPLDIMLKLSVFVFFCLFVCLFVCPTNSYRRMETVPQLKVSSDRLVKPGTEPANPGLQGEGFIYYSTAAPVFRWI